MVKNYRQGFITVSYTHLQPAEQEIEQPAEKSVLIAQVDALGLGGIHGTGIQEMWIRDRLIGQAKGLGQVRCHIDAEARVALTGAVAVQVYRLFVGQQILHGGSELLRAGHAGVTQRVIEHVLISDLGSTLLAEMCIRDSNAPLPSM